MKIGELSQRSGLSVDTIRFYEKKGLLDAELVHREMNNYRNYSEKCVERIALIQQAKQLGFTLSEIQEWIRGFESDHLSTQEKQQILRFKLNQIDEKIEALKQMRVYLADKISRLT